MPGSPVSSTKASIQCIQRRSFVVFVDFLSDPGVPGVRSMGPDVSNSVQDYVET